MPLHRLDSLSAVSAQEWDALVPASQPFLRHAFLSALEDSASLGPHSGWQPEHLLHYEDGPVSYTHLTLPTICSV